MIHPLRVLLTVMLLGATAWGAESGPPAWRHVPGHAVEVTALPDSAVRRNLVALPPAAQTRALDRLRNLALPRDDLDLLFVDPSGDGIGIACPIDSHTHAPAPVPAPEPAPAPLPQGAAVPIASPPAYQSRAGAPHTIYLDFNGHVITNTTWNTNFGSAIFDCKAYSTDTDFTTFSDAEQDAILSIAQRIAEDLRPFNVNVTTIEPTTWTAQVGRVLITRDEDATDIPLPRAGLGGTAWLSVHGAYSYDANQNTTWGPALVYYENLNSGSPDTVAEAASHEIGHNVGLSHDGTSVLSYSSGHNGTTALTSWGPLMGTAYNRNVSQWSKGEYTDASNAEDDLAIISGFLPYVTDDHGDETGTATGLVAAGGTGLSSTGVIGRTTDVDVVSFAAGSGPLTITVNPLVMATRTRGGNLDVALTLYDANGTVVASAAPTGATEATITTTVTNGGYYLRISNDGEPSPPATGYSTYGSLGEWTLSGTVTAHVGSDPFPPRVTAVSASDITSAGGTSATCTVTYADNTGIVVAGLDSADVVVTGPSGNLAVTWLAVDVASNGTPRTATYRIAAPGGSWDAADNGTYNLWVADLQVTDIGGTSCVGAHIGAFHVAIGTSMTLASWPMTSNPGWTHGTGWAYGTPTGVSGDPTAGSTGTAVVGYNLSGAYPKGAYTDYTTTPVFDASSATGQTVTLSFARWLRVKSGDGATLQVSGNNGGSWTSVFSAAGVVADSAWSTVTYDISAVAAGQSQVRLRWGMTDDNATGGGKQDGGWNLDDVVVAAVQSATLDTTRPTAVLLATANPSSGATTTDITVTYTDDAAIAEATIDGADLTVSGPLGYRQVATRVGVDVPGNGSPRTATYRITAPGGTWSSADDGSYTVQLAAGAVADTSANYVTGGTLGTITITVGGASTFGVTYNGNGSTGGSVPLDSGTYLTGATVTVLGNTGSLVKSGSTFAGWNTAANGSGTAYAPAATFSMGSANVTLYAQWTVLPTFGVTYNGNGSMGGSVPLDAGTYLTGATVTVLGNSGSLVKTGSTFAGWNTAANGSGTTYAPAATFSMGSANVTLYAQWTVLPTFGVTYNGNGSTGGTVPVDGTSYLTGATVTVLGNSGSLVKSGSTFAGWNTAANGSGNAYAPAATFSMGSANVTLYAQWTVLPTFGVTYNGNGSTGGSVPVDGTSYLTGATVTALSNSGSLVKSGSTFAGWNSAANGSGTAYAPAATFSMGSANVTLYAQWTVLPTFGVTYNDNGSSGGTVPVDSSSYLTGATVTVLGNTQALVRSGHYFTGWNTAANGSGTSYAPAALLTMGSSPVVLFAVWTAWGQGDLDGDRVVQGSDLNLVVNHFGQDVGDVGWDPLADTDGNGRVTSDDLVPILQRFGTRY